MSQGRNDSLGQELSKIKRGIRQMRRIVLKYIKILCFRKNLDEILRGRMQRAMVET